MDFFYGRISGNSSRAAFGLYEAGVDFTPRELDTRGGENRRAEYLAVNPMGKIPSLQDGAVSLWESNAINLYAAEKAPQAGLIPASAGGRASMMRWMFFQASHVSPAAVLFFRNAHERLRTFYGFTRDEAGIESARKELGRYLPVLDEALRGKEYLEGQFSLADVAHAPHLVLCREGGLALPPNVGAWLDRTTARPAWKKAAALIF